MKGVKLKSYLKYLIRFLFLQVVLTVLTIFYFDNYLISNQEFKQNIYLNLVEDFNRFAPFLKTEFITVDAFFGLAIFIFLIVLYSTKFYTYVNELSFSINRNLVDEYFQLYLLWTSYLFVIFYIFRFENVSRSFLLIYSFLIPIVLLIFRNTEFISSMLGRSVTNETFITFNLDDNSNFRNLRLLTFRKDIGSYNIRNFDNPQNLIRKIDKVNKENKINLIIINLGNKKSLNEKLEKYLIHINKKILLISKNELIFKNKFIFRSDVIDGRTLVYFNNDVQYGSKYILKRMIDLILSTLGIVLSLPISLLIMFLILVTDGYPFLIKQKRVGLHGNHFNMYKFRTMKKGSHKLRGTLTELNKASGPLFKIEDDPRIIKQLKFIREFSLDEIPQFINVLKGEMSLVGPRPLFDDDTKLFDTSYMRRLNVLPGITGLLQINERNTDDFSTWYKYDIEYIENWNLYLDLKIILKTPIAIFSKKIKGL
tara:strand:- start:212 stop:1657 length:1446 start_codon:yes stop_codon:yes gene_type:complete